MHDGPVARRAVQSLVLVKVKAPKLNPWSELECWNTELGYFTIFMLKISYVKWPFWFQWSSFPQQSESNQTASKTPHHFLCSNCWIQLYRETFNWPFLNNTDCLLNCNSVRFVVVAILPNSFSILFIQPLKKCHIKTRDQFLCSNSWIQLNRETSNRLFSTMQIVFWIVLVFATPHYPLWRIFSTKHAKSLNITQWGQQ